MSTTTERPSSLITQAFIFERYGPRLNALQIAELIGLKTVAALNNQCSAGRCAMATYIEGGKRWADYRDAAAYIDACRSKARASA